MSKKLSLSEKLHRKLLLQTEAAVETRLSDAQRQMKIVRKVSLDDPAVYSLHLERSLHILFKHSPNRLIFS